MDNHYLFMNEALKQAQDSSQDIPVGAVIVYHNKIIAASGNRVYKDQDPTAHAEIVVIRKASQLLQTPYLNNCILYVTLEPCAMCAGAISLARLSAVYFGAYDPKGGAIDHGPRLFQFLHHKPEIMGGLCETTCQTLLKNFFKNLR
ncbi:MAG: nucleoside deaminase [Proteobacteria bacterium]|nr:nucleoside deaminase [Pseudomonadota bacterium]